MILRFICAYIENHGYPPTIREIAKANGFSGPGSMTPYLDRLVGGGYIYREYGVARGIKVLPRGRDFT